MTAASVPALREELRRRERAENFPVALRILPHRLREDLRALYQVLRTIDDLGDERPEDCRGDRVRALHDFADDLASVWSSGRPRHPVLAPLVDVVRRHDLPREPFDRLVAANVQDQEVERYATFNDLLDYCSLSAAPVGELVLGVFGVRTPERLELSDRVCAALQVVEHLQDVAEDRRNGRVYLPLDRLQAAGVAEEDLDAATSCPALRRLMLAEAEEVRTLLLAGRPLIASLRGWGRLAVAGYVAGGQAAVDAVVRTGGDVLGAAATVRRRDVLRHLVPLLVTRGGRTAC